MESGWRISVGDSFSGFAGEGAPACFCRKVAEACPPGLADAMASTTEPHALSRFNGEIIAFGQSSFK